MEIFRSLILMYVLLFVAGLINGQEVVKKKEVRISRAKMVLIKAKSKSLKKNITYIVSNQ